MSDSYEDIINLPHHVSATRRPMPMEARSAQFAPFAALSGHDEAIDETARLTDGFVELSQDEREKLDRRLAQALMRGGAYVAVTYFVPDARKAGGAYVRSEGWIKRIDRAEEYLLLADGRKIPLSAIAAINITQWRS